MKGLLSLPARLVEGRTLRIFVAVFAEHGALGKRKSVDPELLAGLSDVDRLYVVPLIFGLMPREALRRKRSADYPVKPHIVAHLTALGIPNDEALIDIIKSVADQFVDTAKDPVTRRSNKKKKTIGDLRAGDRRLYSEIMAEQDDRCVVCGAPFDSRTEPTLDHVIPWRLVGDIPDGANYQFLCSECNSSKGSYLSSLQSPHFFNWVYSANSPPPLDFPGGETRYIVLSRAVGCSEPGCGRTKKHAALFVRTTRPTGLAVTDHLTAVCGAHRS